MNSNSLKMLMDFSPTASVRWNSTGSVPISTRRASQATTSRRPTCPTSASLTDTRRCSTNWVRFSEQIRRSEASGPSNRVLCELCSWRIQASVTGREIRFVVLWQHRHSDNRERFEKQEPLFVMRVSFLVLWFGLEDPRKSRCNFQLVGRCPLAL